MELTREVANRIIDRTDMEINQDISVTASDARVIASTDPNLVGTYHPLAAEAISKGEVVESTDETTSGLGLPITYDNNVLGAIVLHEHPERGRDMAQLLQTLSNLVVYLAAVIDKLPEEKRLKYKFLVDLLKGRIEDERYARDQATAFRIDLDTPHVVVVVGVGEATEGIISQWREEALPDGARADRLNRIQDELISRAARILDSDLDVNSGFIDDKWMVLLPSLNPESPNSPDSMEEDRGRITSQVQTLLDALSPYLNAELSAGIGRYYPGWQGLMRSFTDACLAADIGRRLKGNGRVYSMEDLGLARFLAERDEEARQELAERVLRVLDEDPEMLDTLDMYFRSNLSPSVTARELYIHRHTLLYRLEKIERLTGLSPQRFEDAVQLYAAMLMRRMAAS